MNHFPTLLSTLRKGANLTNHQLAHLAYVPQSLIAGLQSGKRRIGEYQARKIAGALSLVGPQLDDFVFAAINACTEKVLTQHRDYPAEILNLLAHQLATAGIEADVIAGCVVTEGGDFHTVELSLGGNGNAELTTFLKIQ